MSSASEIFLMHLMADSSEISVVEDNAVSSSSSLAHSFSDSSNVLSCRRCGQKSTTTTGSTGRRQRRRSRRRRRSRWEPAVAVHDDLPDLPTRQYSSKLLFPRRNDNDDDDDECCSFSSSSVKSVKFQEAEDLHHKDSRPTMPLRQSSSKDLSSLPRIPRRQNSLKSSFRRVRNITSSSSYHHSSNHGGAGDAARVLQPFNHHLKTPVSDSFSESTCGAAVAA